MASGTQAPPVASPKGKSQNQKRKEKSQKAKAENDRLKSQLAKAQGGGGGGGRAIGQGPGPGGGGAAKVKGKGKGGKEELPPGAKAATANRESICFGWNKTGNCNRPGCTFLHICWFCEKTEHPGKDHV